LEPSNLEVWRQRTSAAFQDSARFEVLLREAVGLGDWSGNVSDDRILEALKRVGADSLLERAPSGLDTQLGASWSGGVDLSGGEWQLVALGRALMRESPALVVLDEPTSALDADREYALFQAISSMVNETRLKAAIVLISHRFSTVALADRIVVLDSGQIIECGTHDDLLAVNGSYAQMFKLQAANYR
jgi:ATP-binding cassette subfamily B protein